MSGGVTLQSFCPAPDPTPRLAVLGIFSSEDHQDLRMAIRSSWLHSGLSELDGGILSRFVIRGLGAKGQTLLESEAQNDTVLIAAPSGLNRRAGPAGCLLAQGTDIGV